MNNFKITFRNRVFMLIVGLIIQLLASSLIIFAIIYSDFKSGNYSVIGIMFIVGLVAATILLFRHIVLLIISNKKGYKEISLTNGIFRFPLSPIKNELCEVKINQISNPVVLNVPRSGVKFLRFYVNEKKFTFTGEDFSEKEFSIICNSVVKRSNRCKACQSTQVTWSGEKGHCHNCETITPQNAGEFEWSNAYQA